MPLADRQVDLGNTGHTRHKADGQVDLSLYLAYMPQG